MADVVLVNKVDSATPDQLERVLADVGRRSTPTPQYSSPNAPVRLEEGPSLKSRAVLVVEDGPIDHARGDGFRRRHRRR